MLVSNAQFVARLVIWVAPAATLDGDARTGQGDMDTLAVGEEQAEHGGILLVVLLVTALTLAGSVAQTWTLDEDDS